MYSIYGYYNNADSTIRQGGFLIPFTEKSTTAIF